MKESLQIDLKKRNMLPIMIQREVIEPPEEGTRRHIDMTNDFKDTETSFVRLVVDQHYQYREESPEAFDWAQVINPKQAAIALSLVQEIKDRQADQQEGVDPVVEGLRIALRIVARQAVWRVQSVERLKINEAARLGANYAHPVSADPGGELRDLSLPALR
jgi:hypothetical protein